jgi:hypothetical protein
MANSKRKSLGLVLLLTVYGMFIFAGLAFTGCGGEGGSGPEPVTTKNVEVDPVDPPMEEESTGAFFNDLMCGESRFTAVLEVGDVVLRSRTGNYSTCDALPGNEEVRVRVYANTSCGRIEMEGEIPLKAAALYEFVLTLNERGDIALYYIETENADCDDLHLALSGDSTDVPTIFDMEPEEGVIEVMVEGHGYELAD